MASIDLKKATIKIIDGTTPTANELEVKLGDGTLTWTETYNRDYELDKGLLDTVRDGDQAPLELRMDAQYEYYSGPLYNNGTPTTVSIHDALTKTGGASSWVSSETTDPCAPYAVDIEVVYDPSCIVPTFDEIETLTFPAFRLESWEGNISDATFSISGKCNAVAPTSVRSTGPDA